MSQILSTQSGAIPIVVVETLTGNTGGPVGPTGNNINVVGSGSISVAGNPGTSTLTISNSGAVATSFAGDSGTATPALGVLTLHGANNITTSAAGSTVTFSVTGTTNHSILLGNSTGSINSLGVATNGQLPIGSTGADPVLATLTAGAGVSITNGAGSITVAASTGGFTWNVITGTSSGIVAQNGYIANNAGQVTLTLPSTAAVGDTFKVTGINNATGWKIAQNSGQIIHFGTSNTTLGTGGSLTSTAAKDSVEIVCVIANTDFNVFSSIGNITVV